MGVFLEHAISYASDFGWSVFPLVQKPVISKSKTGTRWGCSIAAEVIRQRFASVPKHDGIGIATDESCLLVLDVDTLKGHTSDGFTSLAGLEETYGNLPKTVT